MANKWNLHTMFYGTMVICGKIYSIICLRELPFIVDVRWGPRASYFDPLPLENSYLLNYTFLSYKILYFPQSYAPLHAYKIWAKSIFFVRPTLAVLAWNDPRLPASMLRNILATVLRRLQYLLRPINPYIRDNITASDILANQLSIASWL